MTWHVRQGVQGWGAGRGLFRHFHAYRKKYHFEEGILIRSSTGWTEIIQKRRHVSAKSKAFLKTLTTSSLELLRTAAANLNILQWIYNVSHTSVVHLYLSFCFPFNIMWNFRQYCVVTVQILPFNYIFIISDVYRSIYNKCSRRKKSV